MRSTVSFCFLILSTLTGFSLNAFAAPPPRSVILKCPPLPYSFSCSIPRTAHPAFDANCWYRANGQSYLMRKDRQFSFYNDLVHLKIEDSSPVRGVVSERRSRRAAACRQHSLELFEDFDGLDEQMEELDEADVFEH